MNKILLSIKDLNNDYLQKIISDNKINIIDIGCGSGEVLCNLALENPSIYFYGIEIRQNLAEIAAGRILAERLNNVIIINANVNRVLGNNFIPLNSINGINIFFPTPRGIVLNGEFIKNICNWNFFDGINKIMQPEGTLRVVTDHYRLYQEIRSFVYKNKWKEVEFETPISYIKEGYITCSPYEFRYKYLGFRLHTLQLIKI